MAMWQAVAMSRRRCYEDEETEEPRPLQTVTAELPLRAVAGNLPGFSDLDNLD